MFYFPEIKCLDVAHLKGFYNLDKTLDPEFYCLKVGSHDPILVQLSFEIFFVYDEKCWRSHNPTFISNYFVMYS